MWGLSTTGALLLGTTLVCGVLGFGLAILAYRQRDTPVTRRFVGYSLAYSGWMFTAVLVWISPTIQWALLFRILKNVSSTTTFFLWVLFVVAYTDNREKLAGWRFRALAAFVGLSYVTYVLDPFFPVQTTAVRLVEWQGLTLLAGREAGTYNLNVAVSFLLVFWTMYLLVQFYRGAVPGQRQQAGLVFVAQVPPLAAGAMNYIFDFGFHEAFDPTPLSFLLTVLITAFALFYRDFLDVRPMATDALFEEMSDPVIVLDADDAVVKANDRAVDVGIDQGGPLRSCCPSLAAALEGGDEEVRLETESRDEEVRLQTEGGDRRIFDLRVSTITDHEGSERGRLVVLRDVTPRKHREWELEAQNERLEEFASVVSHDLRNPLNVAEGNLSLVRETGDLEPVDDIEASLDRMQRIIDDLLTMARAGQSVDDTDPVSLSEVTREAWEQSRTDGATLDLHVREDLDVEADRGRLQQLLENLFRNAVDHNEMAPTVTVEPIGESGSDTVSGFAVEDDGTGIPEGEREGVFEQGYTTREDGTGFGLSIVEDIVEAHGWSIEATEGSEGGARFEITGVESAVSQSTPAT